MFYTSADLFSSYHIELTYRPDEGEMLCDGNLRKFSMFHFPQKSIQY